MVSISEYLTASYETDCDYVDGVIEERNWGEFDHADLQTATLAYLASRRKELGIYVVVEQTIQVSPTRFRVPDICVIAGPRPKEQIFRTPPFMCIEILSAEDRFARMIAKLDDYLAFGVPYVFLLDPATRKGHRWTATGMLEVQEIRTEQPEIIVPIADLFE